VLVSGAELIAVGRVSITGDPVTMDVEDGMTISEEDQVSTLDRLPRIAVVGDNMDVSNSELTAVGAVSTIDVSAKMDVRDEVMRLEEGKTSALDGVSRDIVGEDNVGRSVGKSIAELVGVSEMAGIDMSLLKLLEMKSIVDELVKMSVGVGMTTAESVSVIDASIKPEVGDEMTSSEENTLSTLDGVSKGAVAEESVGTSVDRTIGSNEVSMKAEVDMELLTTV
jgi:hypothetical protein